MARVELKDNGMILCQQMKIASSFFDRLIGLMFSSSMVGFDGLLIKHCQSIHTFFMRYEIDVVFLDSKMKVVKVIRRMKPWRVSAFYWRASQVLELAGGTVTDDLKPGMFLEVKCTN